MLDLTKYEGHTPGPWQRSKYVRKKEYEHMPEKWHHQKEWEERFIIRGPGTIGSPGCNPVLQIGYSRDPANLDLITDAPLLLAEVVRLRTELAAVLKAKCPACGFSGKFDWMPPEEGCVREPGEYWCPACYATISLAQFQAVNLEMAKRIEELKAEVGRLRAALADLVEAVEISEGHERDRLEGWIAFKTAKGLVNEGTSEADS